VDDKCKKEKIAFDKAEGRVLEAEAKWDEGERKATLNEDQAERYLNEHYYRCRDEPGDEGFEACIISGWLVYGQMLKRNLLYRRIADDLQSKWEQAIRDAEKTKGEYHRCLDRQRSR
jgi:hypothetical protein